ncbi:MAG: GNAT family N-acetyltransferase, partial [Planctomycetota bacterium]
MVRPAHPKEAALISELAIRSKAHWGYSAREMQVFETELTLRPDEIEAKNAHVLELDGSIVGFYTLVDSSPGVAELE